MHGITLYPDARPFTGRVGITEIMVQGWVK